MLRKIEGELWDSKKRAGHSIHEISYRACFKPELVQFFMDEYTDEGDMVYDPFMGRGTTVIEARLNHRRAIGNDANPLCRMITKPRLNPPTVDAVADRLSKADISCEQYPGEGLLAFFHEDTLSEIYGWRLYFREREEDGTFDRVDDWIKMVACSRLTGHSPGFFSVKTLPPNFAVTVDAQRKLNEKSGQVPEYRDTRALILRKTESLLRDKLPVGYDGTGVPIYDYSADRTPAVESGSVDLVVTSPPFLDVVNYHADNWMRMWFYDVDIPKSRLWEIKNATRWSAKMTMVFKELYRVLRPGGMIAFEVGEIKDGTLSLDRLVVNMASRSNLHPQGLFINTHPFSKTSNVWGVKNNEQGTNTNRVVVLAKL